MQKPSLTSLVLRFPTRRIPRPTAVLPPLPNLTSLICYDIDPLSSPDNISLLLLMSKKLENLKLHFNPRMREAAEESVQLQAYFGRCLAAGYAMNLKRLAMYNLYCRNQGEGFEMAINPLTMQEITIINSMGSWDHPMTVFLDNTWRLNPAKAVPENLKMLRIDTVDTEQITMLNRHYGLERLYLVSKANTSKMSSTTTSPSSPSTMTTPNVSASSAACTPRNTTENECKSVAGDYIAAIQSNHGTLRHLLLLDHWVLSDETLFKLCQKLPHLEQLAFACAVPHMESLRQILSLVPKVWALRMLIAPGSAFQAHMDSMDLEMHKFALSTEMWRPEYQNVKYVGVGRLAFKLGDVVWPKGKGKGRAEQRATTMLELSRGPVRKMELVDAKSLNWIEIWGMDTTEFEAKFP